jgi:hypothetical protein
LRFIEQKGRIRGFPVPDDLPEPDIIRRAHVDRASLLALLPVQKAA